MNLIVVKCNRKHVIPNKVLTSTDGLTSIRVPFCTHPLVESCTSNPAPNRAKQVQTLVFNMVVASTLWPSTIKPHFEHANGYQLARLPCGRSCILWTSLHFEQWIKWLTIGRVVWFPHQLVIQPSILLFSPLSKILSLFHLHKPCQSQVLRSIQASSLLSFSLLGNKFIRARPIFLLHFGNMQNSSRERLTHIKLVAHKIIRNILNISSQQTLIINDCFTFQLIIPSGTTLSSPKLKSLGMLIPRQGTARRNSRMRIKQRRSSGSLVWKFAELCVGHPPLTIVSGIISCIYIWYQTCVRIDMLLNVILVGVKSKLEMDEGWVAAVLYIWDNTYWNCDWNSKKSEENGRWLKTVWMGWVVRQEEVRGMNCTGGMRVLNWFSYNVIFLPPGFNCFLLGFNWIQVRLHPCMFSDLMLWRSLAVHVRLAMLMVSWVYLFGFVIALTIPSSSVLSLQS